MQHVCSNKDCGSEGKWQVGFVGYADGQPAVISNPVEVWTGLCVCDLHKQTITVPDFISPLQFNATMLAHKKAPLDFNTAETRFKAIVDGIMPMSKPTGAVSNVQDNVVH